MAVPTITSLSVTTGGTAGGELVLIAGTGFADAVSILFGTVPAEVVAVYTLSGVSTAEVRAPAHDAGTVSLSLQNLDSSGNVITGELAALANAYTFARPNLTVESVLVRIVRQLIRDLKRELLTNTNISVSVDYDDTRDDAAPVAVASLPGIVISGPDISENRFYSSNEAEETVVAVGDSYEFSRKRPAFTADLRFRLTCVARRTTEKLNLQTAVIRFFNRKLFVELDRDPDDPTAGTVKWELSPDGDLRSSYRSESQSDSRAFTYGFVVRGVDVDEGLTMDRNVAVGTTELQLLKLDS
jgi:hypothetical protein